MGERLQALQPDTVETRLLHLLVERRRQVVDETYAPWQIEHFSIAAANRGRWAGRQAHERG